MAWYDDDDFLYFSFGDFNSKTYSIVRTINDRLNIDLAPQMNDITVDVPGGDGQYYFGTFHKSKTFTVDFAFDCLTEDGLSQLKQLCSGKELQELSFPEWKAMEGGSQIHLAYMAKVTGTPTVKVIPFDDGGITIYRGEGNIQFTAYWPYSRRASTPSRSTYTLRSVTPETSDSGVEATIRAGTSSTNVTLDNYGEIPAFFVMESGVAITKITVDDDTIIEKTEASYWNSQTGIIKNASGQVISYEGNGLYRLPIGQITLTLYHEPPSSNKNVAFKYYNWYN